jgi:hypothetical protein
MSLPFEKYQAKAWPFRYRASILVEQLNGGVPAQEKTAEAWIRAKLKDLRSPAEVQQLVDQTKAELRESHAAARGQAEVAEDFQRELGERGDVTVLTPIELGDDELNNLAIAKAAQDMAGLNMFKRTPAGVLYVEGRQVKAALKEAVSVAANAGKVSTKGWGNPDNAAYKKQLKGWFPEHVFVPEKTLPLSREDGSEVTDPDGILQKFVHTHRGDAIGYEEYVENAVVRFTVKTDVEISDKDWAMIWLTGQEQGIGASRSQGFGTYTVTEWEKAR